LSSPAALRLNCLAVLLVCAIFWSPFAAVGLFLLVVILACREFPGFSIRQFLPVISLILPFGMLVAFYASKTSPDVAAQFGKISVSWFFQFHYAPGPMKAVILLPLFILSEFGILLWLVRRCYAKAGHERNLADSIGLVLLLLLPVIVGYESDLSMRASGAPLFCLAILLARAVFSEKIPVSARRWLWVLILAGSLTPLTEAARQGHNLLTGRRDPLTVPHEVSAVMNMPKVQYLGSTNTFFWRQLAAQPRP